MCIIVYKPKGQELPDETTLRRCMNKNRDGAGFALAAAEGVYLSKGYFTLDKLKEDLDAVVKTEDEVIIHFRLATAGLTDAANCHPFPIDHDVKALSATSLFTDAVFAHNGIMYMPGAGGRGIYSDSLLFVMDILGHMDVRAEETKNMLRRVALMSKSRFITMTSSEVTMYGSGWVKDDDIWYSNTGYKSWTYKGSTHYYDNGAYTSWRVKPDRTCPGCGKKTYSWCKECDWYVVPEKCNTCGAHLVKESFQKGTPAKCAICEMCPTCYAKLNEDRTCLNGCEPPKALPAPKNKRETNVCPRCGGNTFEEGTIVFCSNCDWVHNIGVDVLCPKCGGYTDSWCGFDFCQDCEVIIGENGEIEGMWGDAGRFRGV